jgi:hypothetical protein
VLLSADAQGNLCNRFRTGDRTNEGSRFVPSREDRRAAATAEPPLAALGAQIGSDELLDDQRNDERPGLDNREIQAPSRYLRADRGGGNHRNGAQSKARRTADDGRALAQSGSYVGYKLHRRPCPDIPHGERNRVEHDRQRDSCGGKSERTGQQSRPPLGRVFTLHDYAPRRRI